MGTKQPFSHFEAHINLLKMYVLVYEINEADYNSMFICSQMISCYLLESLTLCTSKPRLQIVKLFCMYKRIYEVHGLGGESND